MRSLDRIGLVYNGIQPLPVICHLFIADEKINDMRVCSPWH